MISFNRVSCIVQRSLRSLRASFSGVAAPGTSSLFVRAASSGEARGARHEERRAKRGFTLIELLVVIAMIAMISGAVSTGFSSAQERARQQKATAEVKAIQQAIMAYENYGDLQEVTDADADSSTLGFLLGTGEASKMTGEKIPALLVASLSSGGVMKDPWGTPYKIKIKSGAGNVQLKSISSNLRTGYYFPNFYRLSKEERQ